jgi:hypothetical protein
LLLPSLNAIKQTVISTEAAYSFIVGRAVEKSAFSLSIARIHSTDVLHHDAYNRPIVTILSTIKLVKTLVSWSSQT